MATYFLHKCGHQSLRDAWGKGADLQTATLCSTCQQARIGEVIECARHGKPPVSGKSKNHREGTSETGVSVYEVIDGQIQYVRHSADPR